jgi:hypothetical protein
MNHTQLPILGNDNSKQNISSMMFRGFILTAKLYLTTEALAKVVAKVGLE